MIVVWVALGAAVGAPARALTDRAVQSRHDSVSPWGTLTVNLVGSFVLGVVGAMSAQLSPAARAAIGVGFCGALTTYSTFRYAFLRLLEERARFYATANVGVSLLGGSVLSVWAGPLAPGSPEYGVAGHSASGRSARPLGQMVSRSPGCGSVARLQAAQEIGELIEA